MIALPVRSEPVKEILLTSGWVVSARPSSSPPESTCSTPGGSTCWASSPSRRVATGVYGDGLTITGLPATRAGPIFQSASSRG